MTLTLAILTYCVEGWGLHEAIAHARLTIARQAQPLPELQRKAEKATRRQKIGTQEETDLTEADAKKTLY